jgi:P5-type ATPase cation transporter
MLLVKLFRRLQPRTCGLGVQEVIGWKGYRENFFKNIAFVLGCVASAGLLFSASKWSARARAWLTLTPTSLDSAEYVLLEVRLTTLKHKLAGIFDLTADTSGTLNSYQTLPPLLREELQAQFQVNLPTLLFLAHNLQAHISVSAVHIL